jgi:hypothetical protein
LKKTAKFSVAATSMRSKVPAEQSMAKIAAVIISGTWVIHVSWQRLVELFPVGASACAKVLGGG